VLNAQSKSQAFMAYNPEKAAGTCNFWDASIWSAGMS
jgi:hypothetical protein